MCCFDYDYLASCFKVGNIYFEKSHSRVNLLLVGQRPDGQGVQRGGQVLLQSEGRVHAARVGPHRRPSQIQGCSRYISHFRTKVNLLIKNYED